MCLFFLIPYILFLTFRLVREINSFWREDLFFLSWETSVLGLGTVRETRRKLMIDKREEHKKEVRCKRNKRRKNFVPQFSRLSDSCSFLNISVYLSHHWRRTSNAYCISVREPSWNSQLHRTSLFISLPLTLSILRRGVVVKGKEEKEMRHSKLKASLSTSMALIKEIPPLEEQFRLLDKARLRRILKVRRGTLKFVSELFSPHPTVEKYWPSSLLMVAGKHFMVRILCMLFTYSWPTCITTGLTDWHACFIFERSPFEISVLRPAFRRSSVGFLSPSSHTSKLCHKVYHYCVSPRFSKSLFTDSSIVR